MAAIVRNEYARIVRGCTSHIWIELGTILASSGILPNRGVCTCAHRHDIYLSYACVRSDSTYVRSDPTYVRMSFYVRSFAYVRSTLLIDMSIL